MILTIGIALIVLWFIAFMIFRKIVGAIIHVLLLLAIAAIAWHYLGGAV